MDTHPPDTELSGRTAIVIGASGAIGAGVAAALERDSGFARVYRLSRSVNGLDLADEASIAAAAARLGDIEADLIFIATGALSTPAGPPEKAFDDLSASAMRALFDVNAVGVAMLVKHFAPLLAKTRPCAFVALSARVGSIGDNRLGGWMSYRVSKAAMNQIIRCAAIEYARSRKDSVFVALHPGTIESALTRQFARGRYTASADECAEQLLGVLARLRPQDTGSFLAYDGSPIDW